MQCIQHIQQDHLQQWVDGGGAPSEVPPLEIDIQDDGVTARVIQPAVEPEFDYSGITIEEGHSL